LALRDDVVPANPRWHPVPVSLTEKHWPETIPAQRPTMLIADGLFAFRSEPVIVDIFRRITDRFTSGELAFNGYRRIGWFSRVAVKLHPQKMFKDVGSQPRTRSRGRSFPGWIRMATKLSRKRKAGARKARILRYTY
jgi:O-methyltransferase involved in polyketide biosynthesis